MLSYQFADPVQDQVNNLLADGVMASGVIIGCIFLSSDQLLRMEELPVSPCAHFIYNEDKQGHVCHRSFRMLVNSPAWRDLGTVQLYRGHVVPCRSTAPESISMLTHISQL